MPRYLPRGLFFDGAGWLPLLTCIVSYMQDAVHHHSDIFRSGGCDGDDGGGTDDTCGGGGGYDADDDGDDSKRLCQIIFHVSRIFVQTSRTCFCKQASSCDNFSDIISIFFLLLLIIGCFLLFSF